MQLHQLNFFGFEKTLPNVPGIPLLLMGVTGFLLWRMQAARKRWAAQAHQSEGAVIANGRTVMSNMDVPTSGS